jgi:nucleoside-diphosphate-sugar epimerase
MTSKSKILLTGGSGDLGRVLSSQILDAGFDLLRLDIRPPKDEWGHYVEGSILDLETLTKLFEAVDTVVHIAAWHGIHEVSSQKGLRDFVELNVIGSFNVFEAAKRAGVKHVLNISSTSADDKEGIYGPTKKMAEEMADSYSSLTELNILSLRPRAFIPHWNREVYETFVDWAKWFWPGAVHIDDVAEAAMLAIGALRAGKVDAHQVLPLDSAYEYSDAELANWGANGAGSDFKQHYADYYALAVEHGLDPTQKPRKLDIDQTQAVLGYQPKYSLLNLLQELEEYGPQGPPAP